MTPQNQTTFWVARHSSTGDDKSFSLESAGVVGASEGDGTTGVDCGSSAWLGLVPSVEPSPPDDCKCPASASWLSVASEVVGSPSIPGQLIRVVSCGIFFDYIISTWELHTWSVEILMLNISYMILTTHMVCICLLANSLLTTDQASRVSTTEMSGLPALTWQRPDDFFDLFLEMI